MRFCLLMKRQAMVFVPLVSLLVLNLACGEAAAPATPPEVPATVVTTAPAADAPSATAVPTAEPEMPARLTDDRPIVPPAAPSFAEYWKPPTGFYGQPVYGGALRINYEDPLAHGNIWGARGGGAHRVRMPTMNTLVQQDPYDSNAPMIPDLAANWSVHDDAQGVTFEFREGTTWHNGASFTCEDARFSFETMKTGEGLTASYMGAGLTNLAEGSPSCPDDLSLEFRFQAPTATPLLTIANPYALIFNKEWFEAGGEEAMFQDLSVGTGPFKWAPGQRVGVDIQRFERNPDYFIEELPYLNELVIVSIVDESAQLAAMQAHQTDWHWVRNFGQYNAYVEHDQIMTVIRPIRSGFSYFMNKRNSPFDNVRVRQAVAMGMDRQAAIQILQQGYGSLGFLFPPGSAWELDRERGCAVPGWCQPDDFEAQRDEARRILQEEGFDFDQTYILSVESEGQGVNRSTFMQEQLRLLGIKTDFDQMESVTYYQQQVDGTWGDFMVTTSNLEYDDPAGLGISLRCTAVRNLWTPGTECDPKMEALLDQVDGTLDPVERKRISDEIQLYNMEQYWKMDVYWETEAVAFWPEVRGYFHYPKSNWYFHRWSHAWIDPAHQDDKGFRGQTTGVPGGIQ